MKNKTLALIGVVICLFFGLYRIYNYYYHNVPVAKANECIKLTVTKEFKIKGVIIENDSSSDSSLIMLEQTDDDPIPIILTYAEQRSYHAKRMNCNDKVYN